MEQFHPSELSMGAKLREEMRYKPEFAENTTHRLNTSQDIITDALAKGGAESVTHENYHKIAEHIQNDPRFHQLHSAGPAILAHIGSRVGIKVETTPE